MKSLVLNLLISVIWLFLAPEPSLIVFLTGWLVGFGLIALFRSVLDSRDYVRRAIGAAVYLVIFLREFFVSCGNLVVVSLFRSRASLAPRVITYDVHGLSYLEILVLSQSISLTPGTTTIDIARDRSHLVLHVLDAPDPEAVRASIDRTLRRGILAFTR